MNRQPLFPANLTRKAEGLALAVHRHLHEQRFDSRCSGAFGFHQLPTVFCYG